MFDPIITLNPNIMDTLTSEQRLHFVRSCPTKVYGADENFEQITIADKMKCMFCDECVKISDGFKDNPEDDGLVTVMMDENRFTFTIESNGAMRPEDIVICAMDILRDKLSTIKHQCLELKQDEAAP